MSYTSTSRSLGTACGNSSFVQARSARLSGALRRPTPAVSHSTSSTGTHRARRLLVHAASAADLSKEAPIDWDELGFGLTDVDFMYVATCKKGEEWQPGEIQPFGNLSLSPSAAVLNYGQGVFEGMKAHRSENGTPLLFRPDRNAARLHDGAIELSMPPVPEEMFLDAVKSVVGANARWIPPLGKGTMYIRPLLIGTGAVLGLAPAPSYTFVIYVSPVGAYFKGGQLTPINLKIEESMHRAGPGGTGGVKTIGNYAPVLKVQYAAKDAGYSDILYLDAVECKYVEEVSSCNIFVVTGKTICTPPLDGTILPGITRRSIIELARDRGYEVLEKNVDWEELQAADEVFCTGTAVVVAPVGSITKAGHRKEYQDGNVGPVSQELYDALTQLQMGLTDDPKGWIVPVDEKFIR